MKLANKDMRKSEDKNLRGGKGTIRMTHFLEKDASFGSGRVFAHATLEPGSSIGLHTHEGEFEIYQMLKGTAHITDNGEEYDISAGDGMLCKNGDNHSIENRTNEDVEVLFLVLYGKE